MRKPATARQRVFVGAARRSSEPPHPIPPTRPPPPVRGRVTLHMSAPPPCVQQGLRDHGGVVRCGRDQSNRRWCGQPAGSDDGLRRELAPRVSGRSSQPVHVGCQRDAAAPCPDRARRCGPVRFHSVQRGERSAEHDDAVVPIALRERADEVPRGARAHRLQHRPAQRQPYGGTGEHAH